MSADRESITSSLEVERKYEVDDLDTAPALQTAVRVGESRVHHLVATYLDTADFTLLRNKITLRRRIGGADAGWHLKRPKTGDARTELQLPLDAPASDDSPHDLTADAPVAIPVALAAEVAELLAGRPLHLVATLTTTRTETDLIIDGTDPTTTGVVGAVFCDDLVQADVRSPSTGRQAQSRWREWEVELVGPGSPALLDAVEPALFAAGAAPAGRASKLARALEPVLAT